MPFDYKKFIDDFWQPIKHYIWYAAFFVALAIIILLDVTLRDNPSKYPDIVNYVAIFGVTLSVALFTYYSAIKKRANAEFRTKILHYSEILFASTIVFILSIIFLHSKTVIPTQANTFDEVVAKFTLEVVYNISSLGVFLSLATFSTYMIRTGWLFSKKIWFESNSYVTLQRFLKKLKKLIGRPNFNKLKELGIDLAMLLFFPLLLFLVLLLE